MDRINLGDRVFYAVGVAKVRPAIVIQGSHEPIDGTLDLVVFGDPSDGPEFASGTAVKLHVPKRVEQPAGENTVLVPGTWLLPSEQWKPTW